MGLGVGALFSGDLYYKYLLRMAPVWIPDSGQCLGVVYSGFLHRPYIFPGPTAFCVRWADFYNLAIVLITLCVLSNGVCRGSELNGFRRGDVSRGDVFSLYFLMVSSSPEMEVRQRH